MSALERMIAELSAEDRVALAEYCRQADELETAALPTSIGTVLRWLLAGAPAGQRPLRRLTDKELALFAILALDNRGGRVRWVDLEDFDELLGATPHEPLWSPALVDVWAEVTAMCGEETSRRRRAALES